MIKGNIVTVFGGTGFLGTRVARHLCECGFSVRVASRHPDRIRMRGIDGTKLQSIRADIRDEQSVADAIAGAHGVVNAVSLYVERGNDTFHAVHVEAAKHVAAQAVRAGIERFVHVSGIGADVASQSLYIRKRGEGELAVRAEFPNAVLIRSAVMFGPDDAFLTTFTKLLRQLPIFPMFGGGVTRLQPVYVEDVAEAVAVALQQPDAEAKTYECGGPRIYSYAEFLRLVAHAAGLKPILVPFPFAAWHALAWMSELHPEPAITRNQVELMQIDTVASPGTPGLAELGISPRAVEEIIQQIVSGR
jgi:NADH dehydrogenase